MGRFVLVGEGAFCAFSAELVSSGFSPLSLYSDDRLNLVVSSHVDTLVFECGGQMIMNSAYYSRLDLPEFVASRVVTTDDSPFGVYPNDVRFNALAMNNCIFARKASLSYAIVKFAFDKKYEIINVSQGYARCSVLALSSANRAVTADEGLAAALESRGVKVLRISPGGIKLRGCEYGFIGGASFVDDPMNCCSLHSRPTVYFFGSVNSHPDGSRIVQFCNDGGYNVVSLSGELTDFGGGIVVY